MEIGSVRMETVFPTFSDVTDLWTALTAATSGKRTVRISRIGVFLSQFDIHSTLFHDYDKRLEAD